MEIHSQSAWLETPCLQPGGILGPSTFLSLQGPRPSVTSSVTPTSEGCFHFCLLAWFGGGDGCFNLCTWLYRTCSVDQAVLTCKLYSRLGLLSAVGMGRMLPGHSA